MGYIAGQLFLFQAVILFSILTSAQFTEASTDSKNQLSVILFWHKQTEGSSACRNTLLSCICSL